MVERSDGRKSWRIAATLALVAGIMLAGTGPAQASETSLAKRWQHYVGAPVVGPVVKVQDGDSIWVKIGETVYSVGLIGVAAPEKGECYSAESKEYAIRALTGQTVTLRVDVHHEVAEARHRAEVGRPPETRTFAYVFLNGRLFNAEILRRGDARQRGDGQDYLLRDYLLKAELEGETRDSGLWGACY